MPGVNQSHNPDFTHGINTNEMQTDNPYFNHGIDTITRQNTVTWMLTNYLIGKEVGKDGEVSYPEYLYKNISRLQFPLTYPSRRHHLPILQWSKVTTWLSGTMDPIQPPSQCPGPNAGISSYTRDKLVCSTASAGLAVRWGTIRCEEINAKLGITSSALDLYFDYRKITTTRDRISLDYRHQCWRYPCAYGINRQPDPAGRGACSELKEWCGLP
jgi:hypothetical protein